MFDVPCIIFAGGKSSRMGEDKALLPFGTFSTLTEFQYARLSKLFKEVYISTKREDKFDFPANFIIDEPTKQPIYAPTAGFIAAFHQLNAEKIFVISVDSPFIEKDEIEKIILADTDDCDATVAKTDFGIEPMCGLYHSSLLPSFIKMQNEKSHKLTLLLKNSHTRQIHFENQKAFLNLNKPNEYQEALLLLNS
jgi:molybdenum cofactor guanylyltransferase